MERKTELYFVVGFCFIVVVLNFSSTLINTNPLNSDERDTVLRKETEGVTSLSAADKYRWMQNYQLTHLLAAHSSSNEALRASRDNVAQKPLVKSLTGVKDSTEPHSTRDHAVFLHIPKSAGTTLKNIMGVCHHKVLASEAGVRGHKQDKELSIVKDTGESLYVNVDTYTSEGIKRAREMGLGETYMADVIATSLMHDIETLFGPESKGRVFCLFRNPIERAVSLFNYLQYAEWEPTYTEELKTMSIEDYAKSSIMENNYITRVLTNTMEGDLTNEHLEAALTLMQEKILVGLTGRLHDSVNRFEQFFGWRYSYDPPKQEECRQGYIERGANKNRNPNSIDVPIEGTIAYELLKWQNLFDLQLFQKAQELFEAQSALVADKPDDIRLVDATCSVCKEKEFHRTSQLDTSDLYLS